jgi:hypothetical protein
MTLEVDMLELLVDRIIPRLDVLLQSYYGVDMPAVLSDRLIELLYQ